MYEPIAASIARRLTVDTATSALPDAPARPRPRGTDVPWWRPCAAWLPGCWSASPAGSTPTPPRADGGWRRPDTAAPEIATNLGRTP